MQISPGVSNTSLFEHAPYYKLNKGFFLGFLFKPLSGLRPPRGLNKKASKKYPLFIIPPANFLYPPQTLFVGGILFSRCLSVRPSVRPSVRASVRP